MSIKSAVILKSYRVHLGSIARTPGYAEPESFVRLPFDSGILAACRTIIRRMCKKRPELIIVIGIGGSNLGCKAVYDALASDKHAKIIFAETPDPEFMAGLSKTLRTYRTKADRVLVNVVTKSGTTTETTVLADLVHRSLGTTRRTVVTTDATSPLARRKLPILTIPFPVGGRYSVFSSVGLFPLLAAGFNVTALVSGARQATVPTSMAASSRAAISRFDAYRARLRIHDLFLFHPELESLGKWWRQLIAESLGKDGKGITPTVSVGSTDLHSMAQLYLGGPRNRFTTFVTTKKLSATMNAIYRGTVTAYTKQHLPHSEVVLDNISERTFGAFMQRAMLETAFLGQLLGVNAFDQPAVELYKRETRRLLSRAKK